MDTPRTTVGDVVILRSRETFTVYVVGAVSTAGQDFRRHAHNVVLAGSHDEAIAIAKDRIGHDGRIYLFDIDTAEWADLSN